MKKTTITFLASGLLLISGLKAQTIQEGMKHLYADRKKSAIAVFEKLLATNPNNIQATYWLGQAYFDDDNNAAARQVYEKALATNGSAPLILVGLGHADLLDNKTNDARQKFEAAITAATTKKGANPIVLTAIGRANVDAKAGDFNYAIEKLTAAADKGDKNTETLLQLGNAYRKAKPGEGGGQAYQTYLKALQVDPTFAVADLRLAKIFETQRNFELVLQYLNEAITRDPRFTAAYYELFYYYFYTAKYPEAENQLKKYIDSKTPETDIQDQFLYAQLCWARKDFVCAITKAESVIAAMGDKTKPKVFKLLADANFQKGDMATTLKDSINAMKDYVNAKKYIERYFVKEKPEETISKDYQLLANILSKTGGTVDEVYNTYIKGSALDTVLTSKIDFLNQGAEAFKAKGDSISRLREGDLRLAVIKLSPKPSKLDIFNTSLAYFQGKDTARADSVINIYTQNWPDETFGWSLMFQIKRAEDTSMALGLAVPPAIKYLEILEKDTAKNKKSILGVAGYLAQYYANIVKDKEKAIVYLEKMQMLDPTNADVRKYLEDMKKTMPRSSTNPKGNPTPKPATNTKAKTTKTAKTAVAKK